MAFLIAIGIMAIYVFILYNFSAQRDKYLITTLFQNVLFAAILCNEVVLADSLVFKFYSAMEIVSFIASMLTVIVYRKEYVSAVVKLGTGIIFSSLYTVVMYSYLIVLDTVTGVIKI